jgi:hypothetical protein
MPIANTTRLIKPSIRDEKISGVLPHGLAKTALVPLKYRGRVTLQLFAAVSARDRPKCIDYGLLFTRAFKSLFQAIDGTPPTCNVTAMKSRVH